jgi:hypothetical protein
MLSYGSTLTSASESDRENNGCKERTHCEKVERGPASDERKDEDGSLSAATVIQASLISDRAGRRGDGDASSHMTSRRLSFNTHHDIRQGIRWRSPAQEEERTSGNRRGFTDQRPGNER